MVVKHVCSRVCWATERTSGTPASHFFLSPPQDGLISGDTAEAREKMVGKLLRKLSEREVLICINIYYYNTVYGTNMEVICIPL